MATFSLLLSLLAALLSFAALGRAVVLEDIRTHNGRNLIGRDLWKRDFSVFDLHATETFLWGAPGKLNQLLLQGREN